VNGISAFAFAFTPTRRAALALFFEKPDRFYSRAARNSVHLLALRVTFLTQGVFKKFV
jgi:hypothetical protein